MSVAPTAGPRPAGHAALELVGVTAGYGKTTVLRDVSVEVPTGSVVAMLGANGAGKTTTLRVIGGLLRPMRGSLVLDGADITKLRPSERARRGLCLIPEGRGIYRSLTVRENLRLHLPPGRRHADLGAAVEAFPILGTRMNQLAGSLSGGEQQMLALSRAYLSGPKVVLLDEVSMGLAPLVVENIFAALSNLASGGTALLIVEQYVNKALDLADYACLLDRGRLTWLGPASEVDEESIARSYLGST